MRVCVCVYELNNGLMPSVVWRDALLRLKRCRKGI